MVLFDQASYDKLLSEAPKFKLVTPSILSDRLRVCLFFLLLVCGFSRSLQSFFCSWPEYVEKNWAFILKPTWCFNQYGSDWVDT